MDAESGKLKFQMNNDEVTINILKYMKKQSDIDVVYIEDLIDEPVGNVRHLMPKNEPLQFVLANYDES